MYATVRNYAGNSELVDVLVENESEVKRIIGGIAGLHAYYLIRTADGGAVSISVYAGENGAEDSNRAAAEWLRENAPEVSVNPPQVSAGEVVIAL